MGDNAAIKQSWWRTLPGILTAAAALLTAVTGLAGVLKQVGLFDDVSPPTTSAPATPVTSVGPQPPSGVPLLSLPARDADWQGFVAAPFSFARCNGADPAAFIALTAQSHLVICRAGPNNFYYRGIGDRVNRGIELPDAAPTSGGFDVTNPNDGTKYQIRPGDPGTLTVLMPGNPPWSEEMVDFTN